MSRLDRLKEAKELLEAGFIGADEFETIRKAVVAELQEPLPESVLLRLQTHLDQFLPDISTANPLGDGEADSAHMQVLKLGKMISQAARRFDTLLMPHRLILVRHGQSQGNVDPNIYSSVPDHNIELTSKGRGQARTVGKQLRQLVGEEKVKIFYSPYTRTRQTMEELVAAGFSDKVNEIIAVPDSRLREQEFANFQDKVSIDESMKERGNYGRFYYRFANGESGADVYDRVSQAIHSIKNDMAHNGHIQVKNIIVVTHGLTMRLFLMRFLHWNVDQFENVWNPGNCAAWILERKNPMSARFTLASADAIHFGKEKSLGLPPEMMTVPLKQPQHHGQLPPRRRLVLNTSKSGRSLVALAYDGASKACSLSDMDNISASHSAGHQHTQNHTTQTKSQGGDEMEIEMPQGNPVAVVGALRRASVESKGPAVDHTLKDATPAKINTLNLHAHSVHSRGKDTDMDNVTANPGKEDHHDNDNDNDNHLTDTARGNERPPQDALLPAGAPSWMH